MTETIKTVLLNYAVCALVNASGHRLNDVGGGTHTHEVAGLVHRHMLLHRLDDVIHLLSSFAHGKAADGVAGQVQVRNR